MTTPVPTSPAYYDRHGVTVHAGDCLDILRTLPDNSVDAVITDPPYGLAEHKPTTIAQAVAAWTTGDREHVPDQRGFMGRRWDGFVPAPAVWDECLRVLRPGGYMACFASPRTQDLMGLSIRLAGFEIRDSIGLAAWTYGAGFPKSLDVSKAIDKRGGTDGSWFGEWLIEARTAAGLTRNEVSAHFPSKAGGVTGKVWNWEHGHGVCTQAEFDRLCDLLGQARRSVFEVEGEFLAARRGRHGRFGPGDTRANGPRRDVTAPGTEAAQRWQGWGTALKPAWEPIVLARKPLAGTVAATVLAHGTGALNIAACRVGAETRTNNAGGASSLQRVSRVAHGYR